MRPTPELERIHQVVREVTFSDRPGEKKAPTARRVTTQTNIDRYFRRGVIEERLWKAAVQLRVDWQTAGLEPRMVVNLLRTGAGENAYGMATTEAQAAARQRWRRAIGAVGRCLGEVLLHVVCSDKPAATWQDDLRSDAQRGGEEKRPVKDKRAMIEGVTALRLALGTLADHYGL